MRSERRNGEVWGRGLLLLFAAAICLAPAAAAAPSAQIAYVTPAAMAAKIHGPTPQIQTGNTGVPSVITATVCHGTGAAHAGKFTTFKCSATWGSGTAVVWARALPKNQFCASATGLSACPATPALVGDPRLCHSQAGVPTTADPNYCGLLAGEAATVRAMQVTLKDPSFALRNAACKGQNVTWSCEYSGPSTFGVYYDTTIKFAHSTGKWVATLSTTQRGSTAAPVVCTVQPAASIPSGQNTSWAGGPPASCPA
jgi:hypothetical protein